MHDFERIWKLRVEFNPQDPRAPTLVPFGTSQQPDCPDNINYTAPRDDENFANFGDANDNFANFGDSNNNGGAQEPDLLGDEFHAPERPKPKFRDSAKDLSSGPSLSAFRLEAPSSAPIKVPDKKKAAEDEFFGFSDAAKAQRGSGAEHVSAFDGDRRSGGRGTTSAATRGGSLLDDDDAGDEDAFYTQAGGSGSGGGVEDLFETGRRWAEGGYSGWGGLVDGRVVCKF